MSHWSRPRVSAVGIVTAVLAVLLAIAVIAPSFGSLMPDTKPEIYLNPGRSFLDYLWPWQDNPGMGMPSFNVGLAPVCAAVWVMKRLGAEPWLAARLLRLALLLLAGWGAGALVRRLPAVPTWKWTPLVAATLYVTSPYTVTAGATLPVLLPLATLPWMALFLLRALDEQRFVRWSAAFGLAFAAGSGMNAGVVPIYQLLAVPAIVLVARRAGLVTWRRAGFVVACCAFWTVLLSLYWIVPTAGAQGSGDAVLASTESLEGIFGPSSLAESIRGLGLWPLYGGDAAGSWQPGFAAYLTSGPVVVCSFLAPALVLAVGSRSPRAVRHGASVLVVTALVVMAGAFPVHESAPFGRALTWLFDTFPAAAAFRTTNKVGSLLALGLALMGSTGLAVVWPSAVSRVRRVRGVRLVSVAALVVTGGVLAVAAFPLGTGGFYLGKYDVPGYWQQASTVLRSAPDNQRIWMVPGEKLANYRWATPSPDDVGRALIAPPTVVRTTVPNGSSEAANLLAAADEALADPDVIPDVVAIYARMLGAGRIIARNDQAYEESGALPPQLVAGRLEGTPGLHLERDFGVPGTNMGPDSSGGSNPLAPLQLYAVDRPGAVLQSRPASGSIVLVGDAFAVPSLLRAGLLANDPLISSMTSMSSGDVVAALRAGGRVVVTDTNRRAANDTQRITSNEGPLVSRGTELPSTLAVGSPEQQTALVVDGGSASTSESREIVPFAQAAPENAFDGNTLTAWQFGGFGESDKQSITRTFPADEQLGEVTVRTAAFGARRITALRVEAGGVRRDATVAADGVVKVDLGGVRASALRVTVTAVDGKGVSRVGVAEVESAGPPLTRVASLPTTAQVLGKSMTGSDRELLMRAPWDIVLTRENGGAGETDDEESSLNRAFTIVGDRNYFVSAQVSPSARAADTDFDTLAGFSDRVTVQGSSRAFDLPTLRGSQALDGRDDTAWIPSSPETGQILTITSAQARRFDHLTVRQEAGPGTPLENWATRATVLVDGAVVGEGRLVEGKSTLRFPEVEGHKVQLRIDAVAKPTGTIRISEVDADGLTMKRSGDGPGCVAVLTADGEPVMMRPESALVDLTSQPWVTCRGEGLPLKDGEHSLRGTTSWAVDFLSLRDARGLDQPVPAAAAPIKDVQSSATRYAATTGVGTGPFTVVLAEGLAAGWKATLDGRSLPRPIVVDGFSMGWVVQDSSRPHHLEIVYAPRTVAMVALGLSVAGALAAVVIILLGRRALGRRALGRRALGRSSEARHASPQAAANRPHVPLKSADANWARVGVLLLVLGGVVGGWRGLVLSLVVICAVWLRASARFLGLAAAILVAAAPIWWLAGNAGHMDHVSPDLVSDHLAPHYLVLAAVLALVAATTRPTRTSNGESR